MLLGLVDLVPDPVAEPALKANKRHSPATLAVAGLFFFSGRYRSSAIKGRGSERVVLLTSLPRGVGLSAGRLPAAAWVARLTDVFLFLIGLEFMANSDADSEDQEAMFEAQQDLLESCLPLVFETYDTAIADQLAQPVVWLIDCEDEIGKQIAESWLGAEVVSDAIADQQLENDEELVTTVFSHAFSTDDCRRDVPEMFPYLAPVFELPTPQDGFLSIVVTAGGASVFTVPFHAREE